jgi:FSR family fosmidomycin resistance protein-like MFS transporter
VLSAAHLFVDANQAAVAALLPFFVAERQLSYASASALVLAATASSSVIQPLYGHFSDRHPAPWLMPLGIFVAGAGVAVSGLVHSYAATFAAFVVSGAGIAAFHPEAARFTRYTSGTRQARGMSIFSIGGTIGFALGPVVVTPLVLLLGPGGTMFFLLPAVAIAALTWSELKRLVELAPSAASDLRAPDAGTRSDRGSFLRLSAVASIRAAILYGLLTFVPLYFVSEFHASQTAANTALTLFLVGGLGGAWVGAHVAERLGRVPAVSASLALVAPAIAIFLTTGEVIALVVVTIIGALVIASYAIIVVLGQEYMPDRVGLASGVTLGLTLGIGGAGAWVLGIVADAYGITVAVAVLAGLALVGASLAATMPAARGARRTVPGSPKGPRPAGERG